MWTVILSTITRKDANFAQQVIACLLVVVIASCTSRRNQTCIGDKLPSCHAEVRRSIPAWEFIGSCTSRRNQTVFCDELL
jgi:hypothetical protein